jgi:hypothetical protein
MSIAAIGVPDCSRLRRSSSASLRTVAAALQRPNRLRRFCRTLDGLLNHPKTLRNQQLTDSQQVAIPCIPLISPSLAVEAQLSVRALLPYRHRHPWIVRNCTLGSESVSASRPIEPARTPRRISLKSSKNRRSLVMENKERLRSVCKR